MSKRRGMGTIFWALVWISLGTVLLLRNLGYSIPIWAGLAQYWPVLIIAWGMLKIVDYYRFKGEDRRLFSGGEVALLILLLCVGSAFTAAAHISSDLDGLHFGFGDDFDLFDIIGENYEFSARLEADAEPGRTIEIYNVYGSVEVEAGDTNRIVVDIDKTVRATSRQEAERLEPSMYFTISDSDTGYLIESNRDSLRNSDRRRFKTSLTIRVPVESSLEINNKYGVVRITGLEGDHSIENRYGGSTVRSIDGSVEIDDGYGPIVTEDISGDVTVINKYGSVTVNGVGGVVEVENKYGTIHISDVEGDAMIDNKYSLVSIENVRGMVHIEGQNNSVDLEDVTGLVEIETSYKDIVVRNATGPVDLANRHGDIRLSFDTPPQQDISLTGDYTDIRIEMPSASAFSLDAQTRRGSFNSDFEGIERVSSGRDQRVNGERGTGGPSITIQTSRGDIQLIERR